MLLQGLSNYGPRTAINIACGMIGCLLWLATFGNHSVRWSGPITLHAVIVWMIGIVYIGSYFFPKIRSKFPLKKALLVAGSLSVLVMLCVMAEGDKRTISSLWGGVYMPVFMLVMPLLIRSMGNHTKRSRWFREVLRFGAGDAAQFSTRNDYHDWHFELPKNPDGTYGFVNKIFLGMTRFRHDFMPRMVAMPINNMLVNYAQSKSGKAATYNVPILFFLKSASLIIDQKGEYCRMLWNRRKALSGKRTYCLDPFGVTGRKKTHRTNPLIDIDITNNDGLLKIAKIVNAMVEDESNTSHGSHFSDNASMIIQAVITYVCWAFAPHERTLITVHRLLNSKHPATGKYDPQIWDVAVTRMSQCPYGLCAAAAKVLGDMGAREAGSVKSTIARSIKWLNAPGMQEVFSGHDFSLSELSTLGDELPTVFVALGMGYEKDYHRYLRLITECAVFDIRKKYRETGKNPENGIYFSCDEFHLYAKGLAISSGFGNLREVGIILSAQCQARCQMIEAIGEHETQVMEQSSTVTIFGVNNDNADVAKWASENLGSHVVQDRFGFGTFAEVKDRRVEPLLSPRAVQDALPQFGRGQLIYPIGDKPPMWIDRMQYKPFKVDGIQRWKSLDLGDWVDNPPGVKDQPLCPKEPILRRLAILLAGFRQWLQQP